MIGDNLILLDKVDSTNNYIKKHWHELPSETVVWALEQTEGYGRNNKRWYSPLGGLWFSVLFKPRKRPLIPYFYLRMYSLVIYNVLKKNISWIPSLNGLTIFCLILKRCAEFWERAFMRMVHQVAL